VAGIRTTPLQSAFSFGEFSPWMVARTTFDKYPGALETCVNAIPLIEGGYTRRPGTRYVAEVKDSSTATRLKRFQFGIQQSHPIEMGAGYLRFYRHQGQLVAEDTDSSITNGTFDSDISDWDDRSTGAASIAHDSTNGMLNLVGTGGGDVAWAEQDVSISGAFRSAVHILRFRVARAGNAVAGDQIEVRVGTSSTGAELVSDKKRDVGYHCIPITLDADATIYIQFRYTAAKTVKIDDVSLIANAGPIEIDNPYAAADLFQIEGPQSADVLYLFHESYAPHKLLRYANNEWSLEQVRWLDGPWLDTNTTATTMTPGATTGLGVTVTASAVTGVNDDAGFASTDVGRLIGIDNPASNVDWGYGIITAVASTTSITVDVIEDFATTNADIRWRLGAWSDTTGWPKAATFSEQRLFVGGTNDNPQTFWGSKTGEFEDFSPDETDGTVGDDNGLSWTISSGDVNPILWMAEQRNLVIGTNGGEWIVSSDGPVFTPTDVTVRRQSAIGSARIAPIISEGRILFVQRGGRRIIEYGYNFDDDAFVGLDKTRLARHITAGGVVELAYAPQPHSLILCPRADGQLLSMTYNRREQIEGWSRHIFGGVFGSGDAVCESVVTVPGQNGAGQTQDSTDRDEIWLIVKRTVNGSTVRYVEFLEGDYETGDAQEDAYYVDSMLTYDSSSTTALSGFDHLEGETLSFWGDGAVLPPETVASGAVTLDVAASVVQGGLPYTHTLKTLKLDFGATAGTAVGQRKRVSALNFVLLTSHTVSFGPDASSLVDGGFRVVSDPMDAGAPLFTGEHLVDFAGDWAADARIVVESAAPTPFTLLAIAPVVHTSELR